MGPFRFAQSGTVGDHAGFWSRSRSSRRMSSPTDMILAASRKPRGPPENQARNEQATHGGTCAICCCRPNAVGVQACDCLAASKSGIRLAKPSPTAWRFGGRRGSPCHRQRRGGAGGYGIPAFVMAAPPETASAGKNGKCFPLQAHKTRKYSGRRPSPHGRAAANPIAPPATARRAADRWSRRH